MTTYYSKRSADEGGTVWVGVRTDEGGDATLPSSRLRNHSPDGFQYGYNGSGPSQLALSILHHHTGDEQLTQRLYIQFRIDIIARRRSDLPLELTSGEIDVWLEEHEVQIHAD